MSDFKSLKTQIDSKIAPLSHEIGNKMLSLIGVSVLAIRTKEYSKESFLGRPYDIFGDSQKKYVAEVVEKVEVIYPQEYLEIFSTITADQILTKGFDTSEFLPIEIRIPIVNKRLTDVNIIKKGDLLVEIKRGVNLEPIPIILEVKYTKGKFVGSYLSKIKVSSALYRGTLPPDIRTVVSRYLEEKEEDK